jgi:hypothetical protein
MAMSISPAQMILQVASTESPTGTGRVTRVAVSAVESPAQTPVPAPADSSPAQLSTDMRVDDQHQIYYEVVNDRTGDVLFEIPSAALRNIGESLKLPLGGGSSGHRVDVKT